MIQDIAAFKKWKEIPKLSQDKLLSNVWCSGCGRSTEIILEEITIEKPSLILRGKCKTCGQNICRIVD